MPWMLLLACAGTVFAPPRLVVAPQGGPGVAVADATPVDFSSLEQRVSTLLADTQDTDARERLAELRDLLADMRGREPLAQRRVFLYATRVLAVEERARPVPIALEAVAPLQDAILEVPVGPPGRPVAPRAVEVPPASSSGGGAPPPRNAPPAPAVAVAAAPVIAASGGAEASTSVRAPAPAVAPAPIASPPASEPAAGGTAAVAPTAAAPEPSEADRVAAARRALATAQYLEALSLLGTADGPAALAVRREAIDGWAREERAAAGRDFVLARAMPPGEARTRALEAVLKQLVDINARFPDNAYAADVARSLDYVERTLSGALP